MDGPSPQPALKEALLPGVLKKRKSYNQRGRERRGRGVIPFIHNIVNIHVYITCASVWCLHVYLSVCLSVSRSVWGLDLRSLALLPTPPTPPCPTLGTEPGTGMVPNPGGSVAGPGPLHPLWLQRPVCVRACVYMYVHGEPVCKYVQGLGSHHRGGRWGCLRQGLPGVASSQVDSPQVSGCCDGVALRAQLLGTQGPQPALLAVHMPTLDGR